MEPTAENNNNEMPTGEALSQQPQAETHSGVPAKFMKDGQVDVAALAQAYTALEQKQGTQAGAPQAGKAGGRIDRTELTNANEGQPEATPASAIPGVTQDRVEAFGVELQRDGKLSEDSYAELAKLGYSKAVVDAYVDGVTAPAKTQAAVQAAQDAANVRAEILSEIGGQEVLTDMIGWAKANLTPEEQSAYNDAVFSGNAARVKLAVQGLHSKYSREVGTQPAMRLAGRPSIDVGGYAPFANNNDVVNAMSDPRYKTDSKYRAEVAARLAVSDVFSNSRDISGQRGR